MQIRNYLLAALCWLTACTVSAQSAPWTPFPHNQVSFWDKGNSKSDIYYSDSTVSNGTGGRTHYFGAKYYGGLGIGRCIDSVYLQTAASGTAPFDYKDTLFSDAQGRWSFSENGKSFVFDPNSQVGHRAGFGTMSGNGGYDSVQTAVISELVSDVFGRPDSLKTYELILFLNGSQVGPPLTLKLSKLAGWIEFVPFQDIVRGKTLSLWKIRGFDPLGPERFGVTNHFMDFFGDFQVGDVYKWSGGSTSYYSGLYSGMIYSNRYQRDSITSVVYSANEDAVTITFNYSTWGNTIYPDLSQIQGSPVDSNSITIYSANMRPDFFQKPINSRLLYIGPPGGDIIYKLDTFAYNSGGAYDSMVVLNSTYRTMSPNSRCDVNYLNMPYTESQAYIRGIGLKRRLSTLSTNSNGIYLLGHRKVDGRSAGDYSRPYYIGIENSERTSLRLLNTLANETIWVENKTSQNFSYRLVDVMGSVLQVGTSSDEAFMLSVEHLASGMYFLQLESDGQRTVQKFSVVR